VVGIAAVVIKEKSLQSSKWAIVTSIAFSAFATSLCVNDRDFRQYPTFAPTVGFNLGLSFYAAASLIIATGKLLGSYLPRR
jgi:hypothetical protein